MNNAKPLFYLFFLTQRKKLYVFFFFVLFSLNLSVRILVQFWLSPDFCLDLGIMWTLSHGLPVSFVSFGCSFIAQEEGTFVATNHATLLFKLIQPGMQLLNFQISRNHSIIMQDILHLTLLQQWIFPHCRYDDDRHHEGLQNQKR